jgi:hypothetical protein
MCHFTAILCRRALHFIADVLPQPIAVYCFSIHDCNLTGLPFLSLLQVFSRKILDWHCIPVQVLLVLLYMYSNYFYAQVMHYSHIELALQCSLMQTLHHSYFRLSVS